MLFRSLPTTTYPSGRNERFNKSTLRLFVSSQYSARFPPPSASTQIFPMPSCLLSAGIGSPLQWDELTASTKAEEQLDMSGLETRAARNMMIIATANKPARISWQRERLRAQAPSPCCFPIDEVVFENSLRK